jgi:hypothetical protein
VQQELVGLGEAIGRLDKQQLPSGLASGFVTLGGLLLQMKTERDAIAAIRTADPGLQAVFAEMMMALGTDQDDAIRGTVNTSWNQMLAEQRASFLVAKDNDAKRAIVQRFVDTMNQRDAQDRSLAALRRSISQLAAAHSELAAGQLGGASALLDLVQNEYDAYRAERETIEKQREAANLVQRGAGP